MTNLIHIHGSHNMPLVILSIILAIFSSYTALELISRYKFSRRSITGKYWFIGASIAMGCGIWAMHFVGMLAHQINLEVHYKPFLLIVSMIFPIMTSGIAFYILNRSIRQRMLILSGTILAIGMLAMHYIGMEAMIVDAHIQYDRFWFFISIVIAIISSNLAIQIFAAFRDRHIYNKVWIKVMAAVFLGVAISGMHYAGMKATIFISEIDAVINTSHHGYEAINALAQSIGITIFIIQMFILISFYIDRHSYSKLQESEERYRKLVELSPIAIGIHQYGVFTYINSAGLNVLGTNTIDDVVGKNFLTFIHPSYHDIVKERWKTMHLMNTHVELLEEKMIRLDNEIIDVEIMGLPITINGTSYVQVIFQDITARKKMEEITFQLAYHDPLTGLPNRRLFSQRLYDALITEPTATAAIAVMFIDLDGFKRVNDTYGHDAGDLLLIGIAEKLASCVRKKDIVARLAGDEFTVLLTDNNDSDVVTIAKQMLEILRLPFNIKDTNVFVTPSIGIAFSTDEDKDGESLIRKADKAMYQAKQAGKNTYRIY